MVKGFASRDIQDKTFMETPRSLHLRKKSLEKVDTGDLIAVVRRQDHM